MKIRYWVDTFVWLVWKFLPNREAPKAASQEREKKEGGRVKQAKKRDSLGSVTTPIKKIAETKNALAVQRS